MARKARAGRRGVPPGVDFRRKRLADGTLRTYWFFRALGMVAGRLQGAPGDPEFHAGYAERKAQWQARNAPNPDPTTLRELITLFKASRQFTDLAAASRKDYGAALDAIERRFKGATQLAGVMDHRKMGQQIEAWHLSMRETPRKADMHLAVLHRLLNFGVAKGRLTRNAATGIKRMYTANRAGSVWAPEQIDALCAKAGVEIAAAARLAYATGQRQGDLLRLTWSDVAATGVTFRTSKTGVRIFVPMYDELRDALALAPRRGIQVLTAPAGAAWNENTFRHVFREACTAAGVDATLRFHDLRGSAIKAFADAGATELQIRAITGHSMKSLAGGLSSYVDNWRSLAEQAVRLRENARRTSLQTATANQSPDGPGE